MTEPNTAEEVLEKHCNKEFDNHTGEEIVHSSVSAVTIAMQEHTAQTLDRLKETVKGLKYDEQMQEWAYDYGTYNKALDDVLNLIEGVSDE